MLKRRIIPCLDVKEGRVVKGVEFVALRDIGDPVEIAKYYDASGADELVFLDITASTERRQTMLDVVSAVARKVFIPLTVGGGIRSLEDISSLLKAGADKVSLNTLAVESPDLIKQAAERFGSQCIVVAIDVRFEDGEYFVYTYGGKQKTELRAIDWAKRVAELGAGELLVTSMNQDGKQSGYDLAILELLRHAVDIPIIASGGAGNANHVVDALERVDAALLASILHDRKTTVEEVKHVCSDHNLPMRFVTMTTD
ncbi:MAG: imidazole glycerol phosphate synthase subunit HisF [Exiguobacterium sp.]|mgnify:CR=1 FL=1|uniref:Imidazole glycerol phosphate synthase subunit HisF n=1 Tax=Exiguobacterium alkaliphilum TaxID=1428684 RepID=A0ABT2KWC9_9BACL|nr:MULTISPECIES: imidazole glycerol phosphate synthase subunit HisF [Exiguobacterium]MDX5324438.1 imidazole glycerol phosphate synthase subunit HisF [Exiguobacterium sp.]KDN59261.1 imidazole glycerol phosphate synthase [Exiguobacterium sp. AB2]MCT4795228.1 imidazole glycerol phosphate synthase subunit HisF [Exiguobacterium alkaliphilum]MDX5426282.1 imidazole glycerol phosphate synthase subunit HisF [Exiguobacterium sp.]MDX6773655.1 imidazole glycerol phosphate synthase subunit HisF [Exiguobact